MKLVPVPKTMLSLVYLHLQSLIYSIDQIYVKSTTPKFRWQWFWWHQVSWPWPWHSSHPRLAEPLSVCFCFDHLFARYVTNSKPSFHWTIWMQDSYKIWGLQGSMCEEMIWALVNINNLLFTKTMWTWSVTSENWYLVQWSPWIVQLWRHDNWQPSAKLLSKRPRVMACGSWLKSAKDSRVVMKHLKTS